MIASLGQIKRLNQTVSSTAPSKTNIDYRKLLAKCDPNLMLYDQVEFVHDSLVLLCYVLLEIICWGIFAPLKDLDFNMMFLYLINYYNNTKK